MPKLLLKFGPAVIKEIPFDKPSLSVGRKPDNDISIDHPAISGHHCRISVQGGTYFVEDLESTNGTFVNDKRIKKSGLHHNDVIVLAKHSLTFVEDAAAGSAPAGAAAPEAAEAGPKKLGYLKILKGVVSKNEYELKANSTYIGKSDRVQIPIQGTGLLGGAPEVAASIHRKPDGYYLNAMEKGYPTVNGQKVTDMQLLKEGDFIECGGTTMQFCLKDAPPDATTV